MFVTEMCFMCCQPFFYTLVESGKSFVQMEQESDALCADLMQLSHKFTYLYIRMFFCLVILCRVSIMSLLSDPGDKKLLEDWVKEPEESIGCCPRIFLLAQERVHQLIGRLYSRYGRLVVFSLFVCLQLLSVL